MRRSLTTLAAVAVVMGLALTHSSVGAAAATATPDSTPALTDSTAAHADSVRALADTTTTGASTVVADSLAARADSVSSPADSLATLPHAMATPIDSLAAGVDSTSAPPDTSRWALVLSGGIARGFAHGGVIRALEEAHARPSLVVGASMGGLVGAMYSAGYSPDSLHSILRKIPWDLVFGGQPNAYQWRSVWPPSWFDLVAGDSSMLQIPASIVDNTVINEVLTELFLNADAASQGDFDKLTIPFRTIGTDVRTGRWVMLDHGSLARACRITSGLPLMFPPVAEGEALLVDGGMSSNLPISPARAAGAKRVLAVDVALPYPELDESSSGITVFLQLWDILNKRGQNDTISVAAGDTLVWLKIPNAGASDFAGAAKIMDEGYAEGGEAVRSWVRRSGLATTETPLTPPAPVMPPLSNFVGWSGRGEVRRAKIATAVLGKLPDGPFHPTELVPALRRLSRSGLFESAWPTLINRGDSTVLTFEVRERPVLTIGPAFNFNNDEGASIHVGATARPIRGPFPSLGRLGWEMRPFGWSLQGSLEPYALEHGNFGWFVRGRYHEMRTRVFDDGELIHTLRTNRFELLGGGQVSLASRQVFQAGVGLGDIPRPKPGWSGVLLAFRTQSITGGERTLDAEWAVGDGGYSRINAVADVDLRYRALVLTPGIRFGGVEGDAPPDVLVGLGGPHSLSGLRRDEWLGRRAGALSAELAFEASRQVRIYVAAQSGKVTKAVSGLDLGPDPVGGLGLGLELQLPFGPFQMEGGASSSGRRRFDINLGTRF